MKKWKCLLLVLLLLWATPLLGGSSFAENEASLHQYLSIPFEGMSTEEAREIIFEQKETVLVPLPPWQSSEQNKYTREIIDFGYLFRVMVNEVPRNPNAIEKIELNSGGYFSPDQFETSVTEQIQQFIDIDQQLQTLYGEPTVRYFYGQDFGLNGIVYKFESQIWTQKAMEAMFQKEQKFIALSAWNNLYLEMKVDGLKLHQIKRNGMENAYSSSVSVCFEDGISSWPDDLTLYDTTSETSN